MSQCSLRAYWNAVQPRLPETRNSEGSLSMSHSCKWKVEEKDASRHHEVLEFCHHRRKFERQHSAVEKTPQYPRTRDDMPY
jgi:hypothetical protein